jgi:TIR domain
MPHQSRDLQISVPPLQENTVDFLSNISLPIQITNQSSFIVVVETIALQFQSDYRVPRSDVTVEENCHGFSIEPSNLGYRYVRVVPNLIFRPFTNVFDVKVCYRRSLKSRLSKELNHEKHEVAYLIVNPAPPIFGEVFISYKDPEDYYLAKQLHELAKHAGFAPYVAPEDMHPGTEIWEQKIPQAIQRSKFMFVIWTSNTRAGTGVQKEIRICRKAGVQDILLLEKGVVRPTQYRRSNKEYVRFEPDRAILEFGKTLQALRQEV